MDYKELDCWKCSIVLAKKIYTISSKFPKEEIYGLISQIRRAVVSVSSNIAEGSARGNKEFIQFLNISLGSLAEVETQLIIASELDYMQKNNAVFQEITRARKILLGMKKYLRK